MDILRKLVSWIKKLTSESIQVFVSGCYYAKISVHKERSFSDDDSHLPHWYRILQGSLTLPGIGYVVLYDHKDQYFLSKYQNVLAKIFHANSCQMRYKTLIRNRETDRSCSLNRSISGDHGKFLKLHEQGSALISARAIWAER